MTGPLAPAEDQANQWSPPAAGQPAEQPHQDSATGSGGDISRFGVGLRLGANVGYMAFTREKTINPF